MPRHLRVSAGGPGNLCRCWVWTAGFHEGRREGGAEVTTRMLTEHQGNQPSVDVILTEAPLVLHAAGASQPLTTLENPKWKMR